MFHRVTAGVWKLRLIGTEAYADLAGERVKLQVLRCAAWQVEQPFTVPTRDATGLPGGAHELAFAYFGGVFRKLRYDNLASAVKKILRGSRREETARFIALRSHWRFRSGVLHAGGTA